MTSRCAGVIVGVLAALAACVKTRVPSAQDDGSTESTGDADESESESGEPLDLGETDEPEPLCQGDEYLACVEAELADWSTCLADCLALDQRCVEDECRASCEPARAAASSACAHLCSDLESVCTDQREVERSTCLASGCAEDDCSYAWYFDRGTECPCEAPTVMFEYAWAESCELVLPGPILDISTPYSEISVDGDWFVIHQFSRGSCGEPEVYAVWEQESPPDRLTLCEPACQAFENVGSVEVRVGVPNCA